MNFPRLTVDDVIRIRTVLLAFAEIAEKRAEDEMDKSVATECRMLAERIMEIA